MSWIGSTHCAETLPAAEVGPTQSAPPTQSVAPAESPTSTESVSPAESETETTSVAGIGETKTEGPSVLGVSGSASPAIGTMPVTGADTGWLIGAGVGLLLLGTAALRLGSGHPRRP